MTQPAPPSGGFGAVLRVPEYRWLWLADVQSLVGDQLARVALSVLVYSQTGSGVLTAGVYGLTYLPALLGSVLLGSLADRLPRRGLLVVGDLLRAMLLALMAVPGLPLAVLAALLVVAVVIGTPWKAAESALVADILAGERYVVGVGLRVATVQGAQLVGFALGGAAVAAVGARPALLIDAATFAVSAAVMRLGLRDRPAAGAANEPGAPQAARWMDGVRAASGSRQLRLLLGLSWLAGLFIVPEGLAAPYADAIGGGASTVGILLAANPAGLLAGSLLYSRWLSPRLRTAAVGPLAVASGLPLLLCWNTPGLPVAVALLALSGAASAYQVQVMTEFVTAVPGRRRGQAIAIASAGLLVAQGLGLLGGGALAQFWRVGPAIAVSGGLGALLAGWLAAGRVRDSGSWG
jgi:predicted MFS family arabinose efflux permease